MYMYIIIVFCFNILLCETVNKLIIITIHLKNKFVETAIQIYFSQLWTWIVDYLFQHLWF